MTWRVSETSGYHAGGLDSLGWEMTVCNALEREDGPCRKILSHNASYGKQLLRFLSLAIPKCHLVTIMKSCATLLKTCSSMNICFYDGKIPSAARYFEVEVFWSSLRRTCSCL